MIIKETKKKKKFKIDLFELLSALDQRDFDFYTTLTNEQKKAFAGIVAMRWMSCVPDYNKELCEYHIIVVNDCANVHFWNSEMQKHPYLQYLLLAVCGLGIKQRHEWIKGLLNKNKTKSKIRELIKKYYPTANNNEIDMFLSMNNQDDIINLAKQLGYQNEQIKELQIELKGKYK